MMKKTLLLILSSLFFQLAFAQNYGLQFDGSSENLVIAHKPAFNHQDNFTIEAWIYANAWQSQSWQGSLVSKDGQGPDAGYSFRCGDNGKLSFVMSINGQWNEALSSSIMNTEQWHHVAVVVKLGTITLYVDGSPSGSETFDGAFTTNTLPVNIGSSSGFAGRYFNGIIDEVRIWNVARTQTEIADNNATVFTGTETGLVGYFPMNEGSGTTATNLVDASCSAAFSAMDESNWTDGFAIPDYDIAVQPIGGIDVYNMKSRPIQISADIKNLGTENLSNIDLTVFVNGTEIITETLTQMLVAGELKTHNFITPIDLIGLTNPTIEIVAAHPEDQNTFNNSKSISIATQAGNIIRLFDGERHNFGADGQNHLTNVVLPGSLSEYEKLLLHISLDCPAGGCDPWDQPAKVSALTNQGRFEIARYITPYGISCGPWTVDVTDFKNVLTGPVTFESYIQVWGSSGWQATIDLELVEGNDPFPFYKINKLWETDYLTYGDPNVEDDLAPVAITADSKTEASHIRMTISGHGQGNTNNAAEFSQFTHQFQADGNMLDNHFLWKSDCNSNPCSGQAGSWPAPRAGWCPGQEVIPYTVNTTNTLNPGATVNFDYELFNYTNLLNTGYNDQGHTEPHYRIWSYLVERSASPYEDYLNLFCDGIQATVSGSGASQMLDEVSITVSNNGTQTLSNYEISYFINNVLISTEMISTPIGTEESKSFSFSTVGTLSGSMNNTFYGVVSHPDDQSNGDNVAKSEVENSVATEEIERAAANIKVFPNPVQNGIVEIQVDEILTGSYLELISVDGRRIDAQQITRTHTKLTIPDNGIYFLNITHPEGFSTNKKIVVLK